MIVQMLLGFIKGHSYSVIDSDGYGPNDTLSAESNGKVPQIFRKMFRKEVRL